VALGCYFEAQNDLGTTGKALAAELRIRNYRGADSYASSEPSKSMGLWINVGGNFDAAAAMQVGGILGHKFDVGVGFNANSLISAGLRDDSSSAIAVDVRGTHATAGVRLKSGAGGVLIGADAFTTTTSQLLEINAGNVTRNPVIKITAGGAKSQQVVFNNSLGNFNVGHVGVAGELMEGTAAGDGVINTGEKAVHIGRANAVATLKVDTVVTATQVNVTTGLDLGGKKITSVAEGTAGTDAVNQTQLSRFDRTFGLPGIFAPHGTWPGTTIGSTANRAYFMRFVPTKNMTMKQLAFAVTTAASADDPCDVGIYDAELKRLVSAGATTGKLNSKGVKTVEFAETKLTAGNVYYAAFSFGAVGGTAAQIGGVLNNEGLYSDLMGTAVGTRIMAAKDAAHPLPAGPVAPNAASVPAPFVSVRE
jgi:hypothetical protein